MCGVHKNKVSETLLGYVHVGCLSSEEKTMLSQMTKNMVKPSQILLTIKDQDHKNVTTIKIVYNERQRYQREQRGPISEVQHLLNLMITMYIGSEEWTLKMLSKL